MLSWVPLLAIRNIFSFFTCEITHDITDIMGYLTCNKPNILNYCRLYGLCCFVCQCRCDTVGQLCEFHQAAHNNFFPF